MISRPSCWNTGLAINGTMLALSQLSAVLSPQSCASLHRLGTMLEKLGSVPLARSVLNCVNGTRFFACVASLATSESSANTLCLRAYPPVSPPRYPTEGRSSAYDFHVLPA